ncbi:sulfur oxidation c-type cytochrome SoxX [Salibaculum griseiflavum]|uniref:Sulfur oxidation c-type cytochrome SoxX n=1 Tax=Salibaculum griseiflavum TaxID=1914409 RepID=A0A2V1P506_9RHOB|nr:sulfur oxidation c-type cytochrome SoxX [Salibaculum griseiflavum]PWG16900.1 sulfur oxidation c-type cytochrome SoxX [Salibaculum griseiflavum]
MKRTIALAAGMAMGAGMALADMVAPADVTYGEYGEIEQSLTGVPGDAEAGREVMITRGLGNCVACHAVTALEDIPFHGEVGPILDGVGSYRTEAELRGIVANAKMTFPESVMPAFYKVDGFIRPGNAFTGKAAEGPLDPLLTAQQIEDVVAYLMTLTD